MSTIKQRCDECGYVSHRKTLKGLKRPCPKCGGSMSFDSKEDQQTAQVTAIIIIAFMVLLAIIYAAAGV